MCDNSTPIQVLTWDGHIASLPMERAPACLLEKVASGMKEDHHSVSYASCAL